jgi:uncharacterized repeat protein (TIGR01451 family)
MCTKNYQQVNNSLIGEFQMRGNRQRLIMLLVMVFASATAWAKPEVVLSVTSEKEVIEVVQGKKVKKRVSAKTIEPGEIIIYTIRYSNKGDEVATNVDVKNPVPDNTVYILGSARGSNADISFSADNGKTYGKASSVTFQVKNPEGKSVTRKAGPKNYTDVRWLITRVEAGQSGDLEYRVRVK